MNSPRPQPLWRRLVDRVIAYTVTNFPGAGGGYFGPPTPPTLQADRRFRSSVPGSTYSGGVITGGETNVELLTARQWAEQSELMLRTDGAVSFAAGGYLQTMQKPEWSWHPASVPEEYAEEAKFYAEFFEDMWRRMSVPWATQLGYLGRFGLTGFRYAEQIDVVRKGIIEPDGKHHLRTMVDSFADCEPRAHHQWVSLDSGRSLNGVVQISTSSIIGTVSVDREGDLVTRDLTPRTSADRLLLLVHNQTGMDWNGDGGIMRPAWPAWRDKQAALTLRAVALDRFGIPTPHRKTNHAAMREATFTADEIKLANAAADEACMKWDSGESRFIASDSNIEIDFIGGVFDASNFNDTIDACDAQIVMAMKQPFLIMGLGDTTGSRALSTQSASHFDVSVEVDLNHIRDQINGHARAGAGVVGRIMRANWPNVPESRWPRLEHSGLKTDDFNDLAGVLSALKSTGMLRSEVVTRSMLKRMGIEHTDADVIGIMEDTGDPLENIQGSRKQDNPPNPAGAAGPGRPGLEGGAEDPVPSRKPRVPR